MLINSRKTPKNQHLMMFDLAAGGHHPAYIEHLVRYWANKKYPGKLDIVVSPDFIDQHYDVVNYCKSLDSFGNQNIKFLIITENEHRRIKQQKTLIARFFGEWNLFCEYAKKLQCDESLIMYFDHLQLPLCFGPKSPCPFSGIYFRPTFHYSDFNHYVPTWSDTWRQWRQKLLLFMALQNPQLKILFCLDNFAVAHINRIPKKAKILPLPDPVQLAVCSELEGAELKARLEIGKSRRVFLIFGKLDSRKGIRQVLEAIGQLPAGYCENLCLVLAGSIAPSDKLIIEKKIREISEFLPVQIILCDRLIPGAEVSAYFQIADVILAPYQRHVGMSGILVLAAAAQKPVLASDYGLMGEITRQYGLGLTVDSTNPHAIAREMTRFFQEPPERFCDPQKMKQFAQENDAEQFADTIFSNLLSATN
ncbi:MAG: hypothetical protein Fur0025_40020 [Oscillatoriaceae cyanobacterium]